MCTIAGGGKPWQPCKLWPEFVVVLAPSPCCPTKFTATCLGPQDRFVRNATQLYRSDFFPGLGWMLNRRVWDSVAHKWWVE